MKPFINVPKLSRDFIIFLISSTPSLEDASLSLFTINTILTSGTSMFKANGKSILIKCPIKLTRSPGDCIIFQIYIFDNFVSTERRFRKDFEKPICLSITK